MHRLRLLAAAVVGVLLMPAVPQGQAGRRGDVLDANTASEKQLVSVPGITPGLASSLVTLRPFVTMTDFDAALGAALSQEQRRGVYRRLFVQVNVNAASDEEMGLIPGLADAVLSEIKKGRPYKTLAQFKREVGVRAGEQEAGLEPYVLVPIDLNTASDADIMSIPRMGQRMLREFKEYRPYKAMVQFRREIGKYVDDKEVARLERYVTLH